MIKKLVIENFKKLEFLKKYEGEENIFFNHLSREEITSLLVIASKEDDLPIVQEMIAQKIVNCYYQILEAQKNWELPKVDFLELATYFNDSVKFGVVKIGKIQVLQIFKYNEYENDILAVLEVSKKSTLLDIMKNLLEKLNNNEKDFIKSADFWNEKGFLFHLGNYKKMANLIRI